MEKKNELVFPWKVGDKLEVVDIYTWDYSVCGVYPIGIVRKGDVITVTRIGKHELCAPFAATFNGKEYGFSWSSSNEYRLVESDVKAGDIPIEEPESEIEPECKLAQENPKPEWVSPDLTAEPRLYPSPKNRIYIAGKITGLDGVDVATKFGEAEYLIEKWGFEPVSPLDYGDKRKSWVDNMLILLQILAECDGIYLLDNWEDSDGARIEKKFAEKKGMFLINEVV